MVQLAYAQVYLTLADNKRALEYAQKTNELDITILPAYLILGKHISHKSNMKKHRKPCKHIHFIKQKMPGRLPCLEKPIIKPVITKKL